MLYEMLYKSAPYIIHRQHKNPQINFPSLQNWLESQEGMQNYNDANDLIIKLSIFNPY